MAADQDRAERIKALKLENPGLTWQQIADHAGVTMRAAQAWGESGEIAYPNAKKLAELFEVDVNYIMRGREAAPDLMGAFSPTDARLTQIEQLLEQVLARLPDAAPQAPAGELGRDLEDAPTTPRTARRTRTRRAADGPAGKSR